MELHTDRLGLIPFSLDLAKPLANLYTEDWEDMLRYVRFERGAPLGEAS